MLPDPPGRIGLALGSGASRGWAHVGVLRALAERGIVPDVVCGSSAGAIVGALYAAGRLDSFEAWGRQLDRRQIVGYFDLTMRGGLIKANRLVDSLTEELEGRDIGSLDRPFAAVATDLASGREVWLREGPLREVLRASMAMPGLVAPVQVDGQWLVDGGLVNAVPVSLCRALGADSVIAVDLNTTLLSDRRRLPGSDAQPAPALPAESRDPAEVVSLLDEELDDAEVDAEGIPASSVRAALHGMLSAMRDRIGSREGEARPPSPPSIYEVLSRSINIMQVRITRSRMAGDPPELLVTPRLQDFALLDFDRADDAIEEGRRAVARVWADAEAPEVPQPASEA